MYCGALKMEGGEGVPGGLFFNLHLFLFGTVNYLGLGPIQTWDNVRQDKRQSDV